MRINGSIGIETISQAKASILDNTISNGSLSPTQERINRHSSTMLAENLNMILPAHSPLLDHEKLIQKRSNIPKMSFIAKLPKRVADPKWMKVTPWAALSYCGLQIASRSAPGPSLELAFNGNLSIKYTSISTISLFCFSNNILNNKRTLYVLVWKIGS